MTTAVTEEDQSCLKLRIVKKTWLLQTEQASFSTVIWTERLKKPPKMHNETLLETQPLGGKINLLQAFQMPLVFELGDWLRIRCHKGAYYL